jgi:hypothetical protein
MIHPVFIEVEMRDSIGYQLLNLPHHNKDISLINSLKTHLEEQMGGLICMGHISLPEFTAVYSKGRWVVRIKCCCALHMDSLEQRLNELFEG